MKRCATDHGQRGRDSANQSRRNRESDRADSRNESGSASQRENRATVTNCLNSVRILSCLKENKEEKGRATNTSGIVVKAGGRKIALYLSGRRHAGENLAELLAKREKGL